jgi:hypothetical protein
MLHGQKSKQRLLTRYNAWMLVGTALRYAYAIGLHVGKEDPSTLALGDESLARTWWSLYSLEQTLSTITGRPSMTIDAVDPIPLPISATEEQVTIDREPDCQVYEGGSCFVPLHQGQFYTQSGPHLLVTEPGPMDSDNGCYFKATAELAVITRSILNSLYSAPRTGKSGWETQQNISRLGQLLDRWMLSLPKDVDFRLSVNDDTRFNRKRALIGFQAYSATILLTRPCIGAYEPSREEGSEPSFAERMENKCIEAAQMIVDLLPGEPSSHLVYKKGPWWCIIHHLMQAISVLLLTLSQARIRSQKVLVMVRYIEKAGLHLRALSDPTAQRGWSLIGSLMAPVMRRLDLSDVWQGSRVRRPLSIQQLVV